MCHGSQPPNTSAPDRCNPPTRSTRSWLRPWPHARGHTWPRPPRGRHPRPWSWPNLRRPGP
eukprot:10661793-Lingulodinium_polyedra.AAC.1